MTPTEKMILDDTLADLKRINLPDQAMSTILRTEAQKFGVISLSDIDNYLRANGLPTVSR